MMKCAVLQFLFLGVAFGAVFGDRNQVVQCPVKLLTRPCSCLEGRGQISLICQDIPRKDILDAVLRRTGNYKFDGFRLSHSRVDSISAQDLLVPKQLKHLTVNETSMKRLFDEEPDERNTLATLTLESVGFKDGFPWTQIRSLKQLQNLFLKQVDIPELGRDFKNNVNPGLNNLQLLESNTARVEDGVLSEFESLTSLFITDTQISEIKRSWFPATSPLLIFVFEGNQVSSIPEDMFTNMPSLMFVSLQGNRLTTLSERAFQPIFSLSGLDSLDVSDNPIVCDCSIQWATSQEKRFNFYGQCASPENLKGKDIADLRSSDLGDCE